MKVKTKKNGYWVGFGDLEQRQIKRIKKMKLENKEYYETQIEKEKQIIKEGWDN